MMTYSTEDFYLFVLGPFAYKELRTTSFQSVEGLRMFEA
jgi:hypothetical protein